MFYVANSMAPGRRNWVRSSVMRRFSARGRRRGRIWLMRSSKDTGGGMFGDCCDRVEWKGAADEGAMILYVWRCAYISL